MAIKPDIAQATAIGELSTGMHFTAPIVHTSASSLGKLTHGSSMTPTLTLRSSSTPEAGILSYHASDQQMIQELLAIFAANGSQIATYERVTLRVTLGLPAEFSWDFL